VSRRPEGFSVASEDRAFYAALFERLVAGEPVPQEGLTALARRRGEAVARHLVERAALDPARVTTGTPRATGCARDPSVRAVIELVPLARTEPLAAAPP
jgi:hypothetical protein